MQNLKRNDINELTKQKETHRLTERTYGCQVGEGWEEGIVREFGINMYTLLYLSWITKKDLLFNTRNPAHCYVPAWIGVWGRIDPCMWMAESICCPPETIITLLISYTPIQNKKLKKKKKVLQPRHWDSGNCLSNPLLHSYHTPGTWKLRKR